MTHEEAMAFLKAFMDEVNSQDCRATALPFYYVIRSAIWRVASEFDSAERYTWVSKEDSDDTVSAINLEEAIKVFRESHLEAYLDYNECEETTLSDKAIEEILDNEFDEYEEYKAWEEHKIFFTENAANSWLERNKHLYSPDAYTYLKYMGDLPEMHNLFEALNVITATKGE